MLSELDNASAGGKVASKPKFRKYYYLCANRSCGSRVIDIYVDIFDEGVHWIFACPPEQKQDPVSQ
jgi:hypothetical protein